MSAGSTDSGSAEQIGEVERRPVGHPAAAASSPAGPSYSDDARPRGRRRAATQEVGLDLPDPAADLDDGGAVEAALLRPRGDLQGVGAAEPVSGSAAERGAPPSRRRCPAGRRRRRSTASCHGATPKLPGATSARACRRSGVEILRRPERGWTSDRERTRCGRTQRSRRPGRRERRQGGRAGRRRRPAQSRDPVERAGTGRPRRRTVATGEEALASLRDDPADVVLLDIVMPGMDGSRCSRS